MSVWRFARLRLHFSYNVRVETVAISYYYFTVTLRGYFWDHNFHNWSCFFLISEALFCGLIYWFVYSLRIHLRPACCIMLELQDSVLQLNTKIYICHVHYCNCKTPNRWQLCGEIICTFVTAFCFINFCEHFKWKFESIIFLYM